MLINEKEAKEGDRALKRKRQEVSTPAPIDVSSRAYKVQSW